MLVGHQIGDGNKGRVLVFGARPDLWVPVTNYVVTPVLGWWHTMSPVWALDAAEVESVHRVPISELVGFDYAGRGYALKAPGA